MYLKSYKELIVWQKSIELVKELYGITAQFPREETYGLGIQMRRAAVSIPSNIAEGYKRRGKAEFLQFLSIAEASSAELETQMIIARGLYPTLPYKTAEQFLSEVQKILVVFIRKLNAKR